MIYYRKHLLHSPLRFVEAYHLRQSSNCQFFFIDCNQTFVLSKVQHNCLTLAMIVDRNVVDADRYIAIKSQSFLVANYANQHKFVISISHQSNSLSMQCQSSKPSVIIDFVRYRHVSTVQLLRIDSTAVDE